MDIKPQGLSKNTRTERGQFWYRNQIFDRTREYNNTKNWKIFYNVRIVVKKYQGKRWFYRPAVLLDMNSFADSSRCFFYIVRSNCFKKLIWRAVSKCLSSNRQPSRSSLKQSYSENSKTFSRFFSRKPMCWS